MKTERQMIEEFVCPGCVCGSDPGCEKADINSEYGVSCHAHVCGTTIMPTVGTIALGLPKGFNRLGPTGSGLRAEQRNNTILIRCWTGKKPDWNNLNVPVWAMMQDNTLFVRTYMPRINHPVIDVVDNGSLDMVPNAINVGDFIDDID